MSTDIEIVGGERFAATLHRAADEIDTLTPDDAGRVVASRGRAGAPKRTGRLAGSIRARVDGGDVVVGSSLIYAPVIHNGWSAHNISANPFLARALENSRSEVERAYADDAQKALGKVRGA